MFFDLPGLVFLSADLLARTVSSLAIGAIPIWSQYVDLMEWVLNQLANVLRSGGLAIIVFTIIVKTLLLPLTVKSIRSSKAMQELAPKIKEIQKKAGGDRQKASAEQMALYQAHGVNPMAGCLPMLIQMPIFFGVYFAIRHMAQSGIGYWDGGFLWLPSLNDPDPLHILPILAGIFQFIQSRMMRPANQKVTDSQQQMMNTMMSFMPLTVVLFGWNFLSGAVIYWAVQAMYSVVQQWLITGWGSIGEWFPWLPELPEHRRLGYAAPRSPEDLVMVSGEKPKQNRFQAWMAKKMEEAQQQAQARQEAAKGKSSSANGQAAGGDVVETTATETDSRRAGYNARVTGAARYRSSGAPAEQQPAPSSSQPRSGKKRRKK